MAQKNLRLKSQIVLIYETAENFAERLGIDNSVVSRVCNGRRELDADAKLKWAEALCCRPKDIFDHTKGKEGHLGQKE